MSVALTFDLSKIDKAGNRLLDLSDFDKRDLLAAIGAEVETQTQRRLSDERTAPDGKSWQKWSESYRRTRHSGHTLLQNEGDLAKSIFWQIEGDSVYVGSNEVYAATHQFGDDKRGIPQRQFLGFNDENEADIQALVNDFVDNHIQRSLK